MTVTLDGHTAGALPAERQRSAPGRFELSVVAVALLLSSGAVLSLAAPTSTLAPGAADYSGGLLTQALWGALYALSLAFLLMSGRFWIGLTSLPRTTLALLLLAPLSVVWSVDPMQTLDRSITLAGSTVVGVYLGARFRLADLLRGNAYAALLAVALSMVVALALPSVGIAADFRGEPLWRGVFSHKNTLGMMMAWSAGVAGLMAFARHDVRRLFWFVVAVGAVGVLALSGSRTGFVVLLTAAAVVFVTRHGARQPPLLMLALVFIGVPMASLVVAAVAANAGELAGLVGRDATLTGRSTIWSAVFESIQQRPWLGYGYDAYWGDLNSPARHVWARHGVDFGVTDFRAQGAHNAWLNLWVQLGVVSVVLFAASLLIAFSRAFRLLRHQRTPAAAMPLFFITLYVTYSSVENASLTPNNFFWMMLVAILVHPRPRQLPMGSGRV